jgi:hypothetical protein
MRGRNLEECDERPERTCSTEISLHVLAFNIKRVLQVLGAAKAMRGMRAARA